MNDKFSTSGQPMYHNHRDNIYLVDVHPKRPLCLWRGTSHLPPWKDARNVIHKAQSAHWRPCAFNFSVSAVIAKLERLHFVI